MPLENGGCYLKIIPLVDGYFNLTIYSSAATSNWTLISKEDHEYQTIATTKANTTETLSFTQMKLKAGKVYFVYPRATNNMRYQSFTYTVDEKSIYTWDFVNDTWDASSNFTDNGWTTNDNQRFVLTTTDFTAGGVNIAKNLLFKGTFRLYKSNNLIIQYANSTQSILRIPIAEEQILGVTATTNSGTRGFNMDGAKDNSMSFDNSPSKEVTTSAKAGTGYLGYIDIKGRTDAYYHFITKIRTYLATVTSISFGGNETKNLTAGAFTNRPTITSPAGSTIDNTAGIIYTSSNPDVATVNEMTGEVTPISGGTTTITAKYYGTSEKYIGGCSASYTLTVNDDRSTPVIRFANENSPITVSSIVFNNPATVDVTEEIAKTYTSSNTDIATVDASGRVFIKQFGAGSVTITVTTTATSLYKSASKSYTINPNRRTSWIFNDADQWVTDGSELSGDWQNRGANVGNITGSTGYGLKRGIANGFSMTKTGKSGTDYLPETYGLTFDYPVSTGDNRIAIDPKTDKSLMLGVGSSIHITGNGLATDGTDVLEIQLGRGSSTSDVTVTGAKRGDTYDPTITTSATTTVLTLYPTASTVDLSTTQGIYVDYIRIIHPEVVAGTLVYKAQQLEPGRDYTPVLTVVNTERKNEVVDADRFDWTYSTTTDDLITLDTSTGVITTKAVGTAYVKAVGTPKTAYSANYTTVTLVTAVEILPASPTRSQDIDIDDLLYTTNVNASRGLNRTIPGFTLAFEGGDGVKVNNTSALILRVSGDKGKMTITPRLATGIIDVTIPKVVFTVSTTEEATTVSINGEAPVAITTGDNELTTASEQASITIEVQSGSLTITDLRVFYTLNDEGKYVEACLDATKIAPTFAFATTKVLRIPGDNQAFTNEAPVSSSPTCLAGTFTYTSSATGIATINTDGTNGKLVGNGEANIIATFAETTYFASSTCAYVVNNVQQPGETYTYNVTANQFVRITAQAAGEGYTLALSGECTDDESFTYGTTQAKQTTHITSTGTITLENSNAGNITLLAISTFTPDVRAWVYYEGQEENFLGQLTFAGEDYTMGAASWRVMDIGDINDPIDLTSHYAVKSGSKYVNGNEAVLTDFDEETGAFTTETAGEGAVSIELTKSNTANGYPDELTARGNIKVVTFDDDHPQKWDYMNTNLNGTDEMSLGWTRGTSAGIFYTSGRSYFAPIANKAGNIYKGQDGILISGTVRWHSDQNGDALDRRGLRLFAGSVIKFPAKQGMELTIVASSTASATTHAIENVTDVLGGDAFEYELPDENTLTTAHYLVKSDGYVTLQASDALFIQSITLHVPEIHFAEDVLAFATNATTFDYQNPTINVAAGADLSFTIEDIDGDDDNPVAASSVVSGTDDATKGTVTYTGGEGKVRINVINNSATGIEPKHGSYEVSVVDVFFDPATKNGTLDANSEFSYEEVPKNLDQLDVPINYSVEVTAGNPRPHLTVNVGTSAESTTYKLSVIAAGTVVLKATASHIVTTCTLTITGDSYPDIAPVIGPDDDHSTFNNPLPSGFTPTSWRIETTGTATYDSFSEGTFTNLKGNGAIRVTAINGASQSISYVLTLSYPASSKQEWSFFTTGLAIGDIGNLEADGDHESLHLSKHAHPTVTFSGYPSDYTTTLDWTIDHKNHKVYGDARWSYDHAVRDNNAFIIKETAGLLIETAANGFYVRNTDDCWKHIGLHGDAVITIPKLKAGDYVVLNAKRVSASRGAQLKASNLQDLRGTEMNQTFSITNSQSITGEPDRNPGEYTFQVINNGDVTLTLADPGYMDILKIAIYDGSYNHTMTSIKKDEDLTQNAPAYVLLDDDETATITLPICNNLYSTSTGPAKYVFKGEEGEYEVDATIQALLKAKRKNLKGLTLRMVDWYSNRGVHYYKGEITIPRDADTRYGQVTIRMNNYTAEGRYLIGYTPDYVLHVGKKPHQQYPYTWDFTNIAGGALNDSEENAYQSIKDDPENWTTDAGTATYKMRVDAPSLYVPGAVAVSTDRELLELDGLGFESPSPFSIQSNYTAPSPAPRRGNAPQKAPYTGGKKLSCPANYIVTIPDLTSDDVIYIASDDQPTAITAGQLVESSDTEDKYGYDIINDRETYKVWKYRLDKGTNTLDATPTAVYVTFPKTNIYAIGVTNIFKPMHAISNIGWASESRDHDIDHTLTGYFTKNDANAYIVSYDSYDLTSATVELTETEDGYIPAKTGIVMKQDVSEEADEAVYYVPLFYPAITTGPTPTLVDCPANNRMRANLTETTLSSADDDDEEEENIDGTDYTKFILTNLHWTFERNGNLSEEEEAGKQHHAKMAGFYRLHVFREQDQATRNVIPANSAYLVVESDKLPTAIWNATPALAHSIRIKLVGNGQEVIEEEPMPGILEYSVDREAWYTLGGVRIERPTRPGLYIHRGKKVVVK